MTFTVEQRNELIPAEILERLGDLVYPGGGAEFLEFLDLAIHKKPFPI